jgi:hypothetical protein
VSRFDGRPEHHPEFARLRLGDGKDTGTVRFNHQLHLAGGLTLEPGGRPFVLGQIPTAFWHRYGTKAGQDPMAPVTLDCASCHEPEGEAGRGGGAYMRAVSYEAHCRACHPLHFDPEQPEVAARHGVPPRAVVDEIRKAYTTQVLEENPRLLERRVASRPVPGPPDDPGIEPARKAVDNKLKVALRVLFGPGKGGCVECHTLSRELPPLSAVREVETADVIPPGIPAVWFGKARFDHSAHRSMGCAGCHRRAAGSSVSSDLLLPGVGECSQCHGAPASQTGTARGGAGSSCVECHRYHKGRYTLLGLGAPPPWAPPAGKAP